MTDRHILHSAIFPMGAPRSRVLFRNMVTVAAVGLMTVACNSSDKGDTQADAGAATEGTIEATSTIPSMQDARPGMNLVPAEYVGQAASGEMFEIQSSELALEVSQNDEVRAFAQRMVADHKATTAQLTKSIEGTGYPLPTEMQPRHAQMFGALQSARGDMALFDKLHMEQQMAAHGEAMNLHRSMATRADLPGQLSTFARETLAKVEGHHSMLADLPGSKPAATG